MKKTALLLFLLIVQLSLLAQGTWNQVADLGYSIPNAVTFEPRMYAVCVGLGDKGYFGTGRTDLFTYRKDWWQYDATSKTWSQKQNLPTERIGAVVVAINGKIYLGGGVMEDDTYLSDWNEYDPGMNKWSSKTAIPGEKRNGGVAFAVDTKGYVGLGANASGVVQSDIWQYDPVTGNWTAKGNFPGGARTGAVAFSIGSKGYITTGATSGSGYKNDLWEYTASTDGWIQKASLPAATRTLATGFSLNGYGYLATGLLSGSPWRGKDVWQYNPTLNSWVQKADVSLLGRHAAVSMVVSGIAYIGSGLNAIDRYDEEFWQYDEGNNVWNLSFDIGNHKRYAASGFSINGKGYICCGFEQHKGAFNDVWEFDPVLNTWTQKANYSGGYTHSAFAFAIGDKGYVGGGSDSSPELWVFDPVMNSWSPKFLPATLNRAYANGFVINGKGYVGLGGGIGDELTDLYEYNPVGDIWTQKANFIGPVRSRATAFVINGKAYVGSGVTLFTTEFKDFYEYDPVLNSWSQIADFPGGNRREMASFGIGNYGYVGSGQSGPSGEFSDFWRYDPSSDSWLPETPIPGTGRKAASSFVIDHTGYSGLGTDATGTKQFSNFFSFTPSTSTPSIVLEPVSATTYCPLSSFEISYTCLGSFLPGNVFTAELSDTSGDFANSTTIGSIQSTLSGSISATIPGSITLGNHYRIRIISTNPVLSSLDNGQDISIKAVKSFYADVDEDLYGDPASMITACAQPMGYTENNLDCNDDSPMINPIATDICNGIDDNCNFEFDENDIIASISPVGTVTACEKEQVILEANTGSGITYQWYRNNIAINGATDDTYSTKQGGNFTVVESNGFNCSDTSPSTKIKRKDLPVAEITPLGNTDICAAGSVVLMANSGSGLIYQWLKNSVSIAGATQQSYTATTAAKYKVKVTSSDGCIKTSTALKVTSSCRNSDANNFNTRIKSLNVYPNPASGQFTVEIGTNPEMISKLTLIIHDQLGRAVYTRQVSVSSETTLVQIDPIPVLASGLYSIEILSDSEYHVTQILIQK